MKKRITLLTLLASTSLLGSLSSCSGLNNTNSNLKEIDLINRMSTTIPVTKKMQLIHDKPLKRFCNTGYKFEVVSVGRGLTVETDRSKYIKSKVPVYERQMVDVPTLDDQGQEQYMTDADGNEVLVTHKEEKYVKTEEVEEYRTIKNVVVDKYSSIDVKVRFVPIPGSNNTIYNVSNNPKLQIASNYTFQLNDGTQVKPWMISGTTLAGVYNFKFYTMESTMAYDLFFKTNKWGETLKDDEFAKITNITYYYDFGSKQFGSFDITKPYEILDEARNSYVAQTISDYNLIKDAEFVENPTIE